MELKQFLRLLWRRSWLIILMIGVAGTAAYLVSKQSVPVYEASTTLLINPARANIGALDFNALRASESVAKTYVELLSKRPVLEGVIANLQLEGRAKHKIGVARRRSFLNRRRSRAATDAGFSIGVVPRASRRNCRHSHAPARRPFRNRRRPGVSDTR